MLNERGDTVKRRRKPRKLYSPSENSAVNSMSTPIMSTRPSLISQSQASDEITEDDIESMLSEIPDNRDGKRFKQYLLLTRKALVKDFSKILNDQIAALKAENLSLKSDVAELEKKIIQNKIEYETDINRLEQYGRRSNVEIAGIPDEISNTDLEGKVVEILKEIDVAVNPREIEACHRLPKGRFTKGPARTIVRFVNRKNCDAIFSKKRNLKNIDKKKLKIRENIYINHSLCRDYRRLWQCARKLFTDGKISRFWVSNGTVRIALAENSPPISILHKSKLEEMFPGYDLDGPISK